MGLGVALLPSALIVDDIAAKRLVLAYSLKGMYERDYSYILSPFNRTHKDRRAVRRMALQAGRGFKPFQPRRDRQQRARLHGSST